MNLLKGKHHLWSQLLISMIAFFALPDVSAIEAQPLQNQGYQTQAQQIHQQILEAISQAQQTHYPTQSTQSAVNFTKVLQREPHFPTQIFFEHAPIRAGPAA